MSRNDRDCHDFADLLHGSSHGSYGPIRDGDVRKQLRRYERLEKSYMRASRKSLDAANKLNALKNETLPDAIASYNMAISVDDELAIIDAKKEIKATKDEIYYAEKEVKYALKKYKDAEDDFSKAVKPVVKENPKLIARGLRFGTFSKSDIDKEFELECEKSRKFSVRCERSEKFPQFQNSICICPHCLFFKNFLVNDTFSCHPNLILNKRCHPIFLNKDKKAKKPLYRKSVQIVIDLANNVYALDDKCEQTVDVSKTLQVIRESHANFETVHVFVSALDDFKVLSGAEQIIELCKEFNILYKVCYCDRNGETNHSFDDWIAAYYMLHTYDQYSCTFLLTSDGSCSDAKNEKKDNNECPSKHFISCFDHILSKKCDIFVFGFRPNANYRGYSFSFNDQRRGPIIKDAVDLLRI